MIVATVADGHILIFHSNVSNGVNAHRNETLSVKSINIKCDTMAWGATTENRWGEGITLLSLSHAHTHTHTEKKNSTYENSNSKLWQLVHSRSISQLFPQVLRDDWTKAISVLLLVQVTTWEEEKKTTTRKPPQGRGEKRFTWRGQNTADSMSTSFSTVATGSHPLSLTTQIRALCQNPPTRALFFFLTTFTANKQCT